MHINQCCSSVAVENAGLACKIMLLSKQYKERGLRSTLHKKGSGVAQAASHQPNASFVLSEKFAAPQFSAPPALSGCSSGSSDQCW